MLGQVLGHTLDAADRNIRLYDKTVTVIVDVFEKHGEKPPDMVKKLFRL